MIVSSFRKEYGVNVYSPEFKNMTWDEFCTLLSGLGETSPLARTVQIRLEEDPDVLKHFNSAQRRIRDEWRSRNKKNTAVNMSEKAHMQFLAQIQGWFAQQGGGAG